MKFFNHIFPIFTLILILTSCEIENGPVKIVSLTPSDTIVSNNKSILLVCIAEDGDNDKLRYSWNSSSGTIVSGNKDSAIWTAPNEYGYQTITVKVSDDLGSSDALGTSIKVIPNRAPIALDSTDTISANMEYSGIFNAYDPDDDSLIFLSFLCLQMVLLTLLMKRAELILTILKSGSVELIALLLMLQMEN